MPVFGVLEPAHAYEGTIETTTGEWRELSLTAPEGMVFTEILWSSFGNATEYYSYGECHSENSSEILSSYLGYSTFIFNESLSMKDIFGDPCHGVGKALMLVIAYDLDPSAPVPEEATQPEEQLISQADVDEFYIMIDQAFYDYTEAMSVAYEFDQDAWDAQVVFAEESLNSLYSKLIPDLPLADAQEAYSLWYVEHYKLIDIVLSSSTLEPSPEPSPEPEPVATEEPQPAPEPEPTQTPEPQPSPIETAPVVQPPVEPSPEPVQPKPAPQPKPQPAPQPEVVEPSPPEPSQEPEPVASETPEPEPSETSAPTPEPSAEPTPTKTPAPKPTVAQTITPSPSPTVTEEPKPAPSPTPTIIPEPAPEPTEKEVVIEKINTVLTEISQESEMTTETKQVILDQKEELVAATNVVFESASSDSEEYKEALEVLAIIAQADDVELPEELAAIPVIGAVAGEVLNAFNDLGNVGADMSPEQRERSEETVVAAVIVGQVAQLATATAASAGISAAAASTRRIR